MERYIKNKNLQYILYFLAVLPLFFFRDFTPDNELRYLSIADEALENGSIFTFTNHGMFYADKPPLYLWIVMLGKIIFGFHSMVFLGMFSIIPALVVLWVMDKWMKNVLTNNERLVAQLMLLTSGLFLGTAIVLRMDMLMCMFIVLALNTFFKIFSGIGKPHHSILFPFIVFMAIFTKGPVGIIVPLISTIVFLLIKKEGKTIGKYWGFKTLSILLVLCAIWFGAAYAEGGSQYLKNLLFNQTINRAINSFHHEEPFYYYFIAILYSLAPWSLLIIGVYAAAIKNKLKFNDLELFFLVISVSTFVVLSIFSSKLAVYLLPTFPFFVYLSVLWLSKLKVANWMFVLIGIMAFVFGFALPGILIAYPHLGLDELGISVFVCIAALVLSVSGILTLRFFAQKQLYSGILRLSTGILLSIFVASFSIPKYNPQLGVSELCRQAKQVVSRKVGVTYYYLESTRADNFEVFLNQKVEKLEIRDLYKPNMIKKPAIIFTWDKAIERNDSIQVFIKDKKISWSGSYCFIEVD